MFVLSTINESYWILGHRKETIKLNDSEFVDHRNDQLKDILIDDSKLVLIRQDTQNEDREWFKMNYRNMR